MPSGSKKRKAAKKKKKHLCNHSNPWGTADEDVKHQDEKNIDIGDVNSPVSQNHNSHQNFLMEGEDEKGKNGGNISNVPYVEGLKIEGGEQPEAVLEEDNVVEVKRDYKIEDESDENDACIKHNAAVDKSCNGGSFSSSGSSSSSWDDEYGGLKSSQAANNIADVADNLSQKPAEDIHGAQIIEAGDSVEENIPVAGVEEVPLLAKQAEVNMRNPADNYVASYVVDFVQNGKQKLSSGEDKVCISSAYIDAESERKDEAIVRSVENSTSLEPKECLIRGNDHSLTLSYSQPQPTADDGEEIQTQSGVTEPLPAPCRRHIQTTSWKSCCGLFELFSGSDK